MYFVATARECRRFVLVKISTSYFLYVEFALEIHYVLRKVLHFLPKLSYKVFFVDRPI